MENTIGEGNYLCNLWDLQDENRSLGDIIKERLSELSDNPKHPAYTIVLDVITPNS